MTGQNNKKGPAQGTENGEKPRFHVLPNAASGAGSAMAAPLTGPVTAKTAPKPVNRTKKSLNMPAVGLVTAKKAARQKTATGATTKTPETPPQHDKQEEIDMSKTKDNFEKLAEETVAFNQEQLDALIKSGNLFMAGTQDILKTYAGLAQKAVEQNSSAVSSLMGCKTLAELGETQNRLAREAFEELVNNATQLSELSVKIATESLEPLNTQLGKAVQKATEAAA